jgi:hypothetical protein
MIVRGFAFNDDMPLGELFAATQGADAVEQFMNIAKRLSVLGPKRFLKALHKRPAQEALEVITAVATDYLRRLTDLGKALASTAKGELNARECTPPPAGG